MGYKYGQHDTTAEFVPLHESVPQVFLMCVAADASFPCALMTEQPEAVEHSKDM